jgi:hypothetical protein
MRYLALVALLAFLAVPFMAGCGDTAKPAPKTTTGKTGTGTGNVGGTSGTVTPVDTAKGGVAPVETGKGAVEPKETGK